MREIDRRQFGDGVAAFAMLLASGALAAPSPSPDDGKAPHKMPDMPAYWRGKERVAFLIYPGFTALDMVGPQYMFANLMGATIEIVGKSRDPIRSDTGIVFTPSAKFEDAASDLDILCVPGGSTGTLAAMRDEETLAYIRAAGHGARFVTSVCTGSMLLGSAGLLDGYRATSHWITKPLLPVFGATPAEGRFVRDRNRITAEGVTAGLDFALALVAELRDRKYAEGVQLLAQYAPAPPFNAGEPGTAPAAVTTMLDTMFAGFKEEMRAAAAAAYARSKAL
ncbi:MAG: DJ-1/PfpI family protein [Alphaproteobacteria bacterium]|nr:DJ-1/PfpI family protein [Alphaproteobacteria bacterium]MBM3653254.1 DJ-1/PfpI family protein [Alphaproteobacteria bacterium]